MKKITYLVASLMLMGTTPMLTGCVDTDEPAGIEELRGAKAELLTAKAAVEKAKVATEEANAAYRLAEAEYVKAQAAREKAAAAVEEAKAAKIQAEAEIAKAESENKIALANAKSAIEKAKAEQELAEAKANAEQKAAMAEIARQKAEQELAELKTAAEQATKEWELSYQKAQDQYQLFLVQLAITKSNTIDAALASYKTAVVSAKSALDTKSEALRQAQIALNEALADFEESEAQKELNTRNLQKAVNTAKNDVAAAEVVLEGAKEAYADAQTIEASELETKRDEQQAKVNAQIKKIADLEIAATEYEKLYYPEVTEKWNAYKKAYVTRVEIPAISLDVPATIDFVSGKLISEATSYTLHASDPEEPVITRGVVPTGTVNYETRKASLEELIGIANSYLGDAAENEKYWTREELSALQAEIDETKETYEEAYDAWQELASAYATGNYKVADATKITGYDKLASDVKAYNKQVEILQAVLKAADELDAKEDSLEEACKLAITKAEETLSYSEVSGMLAYEEAVREAAGKAYDEVDELNDKVEKAQEKYDEAYKAWIEADGEDKPGKKQTLDEANEALKTAKKNANVSAATLAENAKAQALVTFNTSANAAQKAAGEAIRKIVLERDSAYAKIRAHWYDLEKAGYEATLAGDAAVDSIKVSFKTFKANAKGTNVKGISYVKTRWSNQKTVDIDVLTALDKDQVEGAVCGFSESLYGEQFYDRLIPVSAETIKAAVADSLKAKAVEPEVGESGEIAYTISELDDVLEEYDKFGIFGKLLGLEYMKSVMEQTMGDNSEMKALVATLQKYLDDMVAANEAAEEAAEDAYDAWYAATVKYADGNTATAEIETANVYKQGLEEVLQKYKDAVVDYIEAGEDGKTFYADLRAAYVEETKAAVAKAETALYDAETVLMQAEQNLKSYKSNEETLYEQAAKALETAQVAYKAAVETYDAALEALNKKIADITVE